MKGYLVQVNVPIQVYVEIDEPGPDSTPYIEANRAGIKQVLNGIDDTAWNEAMQRLRDNGLDYPSDFAETVEEVNADPEI